jgi:hypothetical protein
MRFNSKFILILTATLLTACAKQKAESDSTVNAVNASVEGGITTVDALVDDQAGSTFAASLRSSPTLYAEKLFNQILPPAYAVSCARAIDQSCSAGERQISFSSCDLPRGHRFSGWIKLNYSSATCSLANTGEQVTRTYDYDISGPYGGVLSVTSDGGGRLTKTAGGWSVEILGKHKELTFRGRKLVDLSISTPTALQVTGSLSRQSRVINSGSYQVVHNLAGFTAVYVPQNLTYESSCCHPVSGSLSVTFTGSVTGSGSVTFNGCGQASLTRNGQTQDIGLNYCE